MPSSGKFGIREIAAVLPSGYASVLLIISVAVGIAAYRSSETFRRANGVAPWRIPSFVWALIFFVSWLLGLILFSIAKRGTRNRLQESTGTDEVDSRWT